MNIEYWIPIAGVVALLFVLLKSRWIMKQDAGNEIMKKVSDHIHEGAIAFLKTEYTVLLVYVILASVLLGWLSMRDAASSPIIIGAFILGAGLSALAGFIGMSVATRANVRTTQAARSSLSKAL